MLLQLESISSAFNAFEAIQTSSSVAKEGEGMEIDSSGNYERERERLRRRGTWRKERRRLRRPDRFERESLTFGMRTIGARAHPGSPTWGSDQQTWLKVGIKVSQNYDRFSASRRLNDVLPIGRKLRDTSRPSFVSVKQPSFPSKRRQFLPRSRPRHSTLLARYSRPTSRARARTHARDLSCAGVPALF
ncbi:hypothetical protein ALC57_15332 [Trachymyrmex cornetzi]|uniref:Uncharacterized protein n=1 Tax=Trachymyrmex cornetzi TaxID=471704 RepID=A0A195DI86_9HYME|nr:hypothetical protein ALC57_15332 [Trachymyrmex cornetzi]